MNNTKHAKLKALYAELALYLDPEVVKAAQHAANSFSITLNMQKAFEILYADACITALKHGLPKAYLARHFCLTEDELTVLIGTDTEVKFTFTDKELDILEHNYKAIRILAEVIGDESFTTNPKELTAQYSAAEYVSIPYILFNLRNKAVYCATQTMSYADIGKLIGHSVGWVEWTTRIYAKTIAK